MSVAQDTDLAEFIAFAMSVIAIPFFLLVFVTVMVMVSPVVLPLWLYRRHSRT